MSTQWRAFRPLGHNRTVSGVTTAAATNIVLPDTPMGTRAFRIVNAGTDTTFVEIAEIGSAVPTVTTSMPMLPNTVEVFTVTNEMISIRLIGVAGGNTVYLTPGEGL